MNENDNQNMKKNDELCELHNHGITKLRRIGSVLNIPSYSKYMAKDKEQLINKITQLFQSFNDEKKKGTMKRINKIIGKDNSDNDKWTKIKQLGVSGKEGTTYLVVNDNGDPYAMKTFKSSKSAKKIEQEKNFQVLAASNGISPKVYDYDLDHKFIVMDKLNKTLLQLVSEQKGQLTRTQERKLYNLYEKLDNIKVFHNDANPLNVMEGKDGNLYMIDYGFSKFIKDGKSLNTALMPAATIIWLKKFFPNIKATFLRQKVDIDMAKKIYGQENN